MKRIFSLFALGALSAVAVGAVAVAAQTTASGQAGGSMKSGAQANSSNPSGATASGSTSAKASTSSSAKSKKAIDSVTIATGTKIDATLVSWLDARRSRVGAPIEARIEQDVKQGGKVVLPKGTKLGGRVTEARARVGIQGESRVGISFERALLANGQSIPFHASILALSAPQIASAAGAGGTMGATEVSAGAGEPAAAMNTSNASPSTASGTMNTAARSSGRLSSSSRGVIGLDGLSLSSAKTSATQGSTIVSRTKNVHLNSGTEMMLQTSTQAH